MKTAIITASLDLASLGLIAQEKKATTVRIKKIEKINLLEIKLISKLLKCLVTNHLNRCPKANYEK